MRPQTRTDLAMTAAILLLGASLIYSGFSLLQLRVSRDGAVATPPLTLPELLAAAGAGTGIALLCWWLLALVCACISAVAHTLGAPRLAALTGSWTPAFMRRVVAAVLGINLLAAPLASTADSPGLDPLWHAGTVATAPAYTAGEDADPATGTPTGAAATGAAANILPAESAAPVEPQWIPRAAATDPGPMLRPSLRPHRPPAGDEVDTPGAAAPNSPAEPVHGASQVVVRSGDSLWSIAAASLGPYASDIDVAMAWPAWYKTNRTVIGADPNFILPGQVLAAPPGH